MSIVEIARQVKHQVPFREIVRQVEQENLVCRTEDAEMIVNSVIEAIQKGTVKV